MKYYVPSTAICPHRSRPSWPRTVSKLLARMLRETVERETGYDAARERSLARLHEGVDLGTRGHAVWSRDDVHER